MIIKKLTITITKMILITRISLPHRTWTTFDFRFLFNQPIISRDYSRLGRIPKASKREP